MRLVPTKRKRGSTMAAEFDTKNILENDTREALFGELRYLVSAIEYGWDEDIECVVSRFKYDYPLLPEYDEDDDIEPSWLGGTTNEEGEVYGG